MFKQKEMKVFLKKYKVSLIAISENIVQENKTNIIFNKFMPNWKWCINTGHVLRCRIWVVWNPDDIQFIVLDTSSQDS